MQNDALNSACGTTRFGVRNDALWRAERRALACGTTRFGVQNDALNLACGTTRFGVQNDALNDGAGWMLARMKKEAVRLTEIALRG